MALKMRFVHGHVLGRAQTLANLDLQNSINEEKGIAMRQSTQDLMNIKTFHEDS